MVVGGLIGAAIALYGRYVEPFRLRLAHQTIELPRAHAHLDGLTIAFVSDTHVGPHFSASDLERAVDAVHRIEPDLVLFGGDYISESPRYLEDALDPLRRIAGSARLGAFAILGNHDISNVRHRVEAGFQRVGARLLVNEAVPVPYGGGQVWIVGIDDILLGHARVDEAFAAVPAGAPTVAMWHEPDLAERVAPWEPLVLLSGHTHGGQIRVPGMGELAVPKLGKRFPDGRYTVEGMTLIVGRGVGIYRPPVRINCPPEIVVLHFVA
jgi:predicted MPP superfamily phosphohydrolase